MEIPRKIIILQSVILGKQIRFFEAPWLTMFIQYTFVTRTDVNFGSKSFNVTLYLAQLFREKRKYLKQGYTNNDVTYKPIFSLYLKFYSLF